jgi:YHS domain-containing protein
MLKTLSMITVLLASWQIGATPTAEQPDRNVEFYNLPAGSDLALQGYDPVAFFEEHGAQALTGKSDITTTYGGVTYRFASIENREIFLGNPTKYEPTYGGWCAWAMANQGYAPINPIYFTQHGNRMHFFIRASAKRNFDNNLEFHESNADDFWKSESGEEPRI